MAARQAIPGNSSVLIGYDTGTSSAQIPDLAFPADHGADLGAVCFTAACRGGYIRSIYHGYNHHFNDLSRFHSGRKVLLTTHGPSRNARRSSSDAVFRAIPVSIYDVSPWLPRRSQPTPRASSPLRAVQISPVAALEGIGQHADIHRLVINNQVFHCLTRHCVLEGVPQ